MSKMFQDTFSIIKQLHFLKYGPPHQSACCPGLCGQLQAVSVPQDPWLFALDECFWETFQVDQAEFERC